MRKGKYSEKLVNNKIQELPEEYVVFNDLLFESNGSVSYTHLVLYGNERTTDRYLIILMK